MILRGKHMSDTIIVALLSLAGTLIGSIFGIIASNKLVVYRIEQLEKKVEKHNNVLERVYTLEKDEALLKEEISIVNDKVKDLEESH